MQPDGTRQAPHLRSVSGHTSREALLQVRVGDKANEIPVAHALLPYLPSRGRVVTADALHTQTAFAQGVLDRGGDYLRGVKGNQPTRYADIALAFADRGHRPPPRRILHARPLQRSAEATRGAASLPGRRWRWRSRHRWSQPLVEQR